jgi:DNA-binding NtrC family response regulator
MPSAAAAREHARFARNPGTISETAPDEPEREPPMARSQDALELLLPDADAKAVRRARDVTHFLRLLSDDARPARAQSVGVDLQRARTELERADRADLECALTDLLRHHLAAIQPAESFAWFGEPDLDHVSAWRVLGEFAEEFAWITPVPEPGESASSVVTRLTANLERSGAGARKLALWRARTAHVVDGPRAGERLYRDELRASPDHAGARAGASTTPVHVRALVAGVAECLLERGAAREARAWLTEHAALVGIDARLRQLLAWTRLVLGDAAGARLVLVGTSPWPGVLPAGLADLRAHRPEWLPCLAGRSATPRTPREERAVRDRHELGACVLAVFTFQPGAGARPIFFECAPGLKAEAARWLDAREGAGSIPGEPEQRVVAGARTIAEHAETPGALRGTLGRANSVARMLAPALDDDGEVAGWVHVECEHHLLPTAARLEAIARAWSGEILRSRYLADHEPEVRGLVTPREPAPDSPAARVLGDLVANLGIKLHQRLWWGFEVEEGATRRAANGGEGVGFAAERAGQARGLVRSLATAACVGFDDPDERLSVRADAASGVVLPLLVEGRACGLLAIESSRRRDFKAKDVEACAHVVARHALDLRVAQFRGWHAAQFSFEPWFDAQRQDFASFARTLILAARSECALALCGPAGAGKLVLARWIHFESARAHGPFKVHSCGTGAARFEALLASARAGSLVFDDVERLEPELQEELLRHLEQVDRADRAGTGASRMDSAMQSARRIEGASKLAVHTEGATGLAEHLDGATAGDVARILVTTTVGLAAAAEAGRLRADLALRLDRLTLVVPSLRERREEIPELGQSLARRFAAEEGVDAPVFTDEALALLWRQSWEGNVRELENLIFKLVLLHPGESVTPEAVGEICRQFGIELVRRLPSRHPDRRDLVAALRTTRKAGGRLNKTRAAQYLGWDPDTLVSRMQSCGIPEEGFETEEAWRTACTKHDACNEGEAV